MSLWQKPMSEVTFQDIDAFCSAKHREGTRCDYKVDFPKNLEKTIAAFANTLGGLILIGIGSDKKTNTPNWPAQTGLASEDGLEERVYQKATEAIYPPVRVTVSPVIENPNLPGNVIIVVRVDESKDAPHTVDNGRQVLVYERSDNKTDPIQLAKIDRIEHLLNRRRAIASQSDESRARIMDRSRRLLDPTMMPYMWASVAPTFPWRQLCKWSDCHDFLVKEFHLDRVRRIPLGALYVSVEHITRGTTTQASNLRTITCDAMGQFLHMRSIFGTTRVMHGITRISDELHDMKMELDAFTRRFNEMLAFARKFYSESVAERPGLMTVQIGCVGIKSLQLFMPTYYTEPTPYLDDDYVDEVTVTADEFLSDDGWQDIALDFSARIAYSFNVKTEQGL